MAPPQKFKELKIGSDYTFMQSEIKISQISQIAFHSHKIDCESFIMGCAEVFKKFWITFKFLQPCPGNKMCMLFI